MIAVEVEGRQAAGGGLGRGRADTGLGDLRLRNPCRDVAGDAAGVIDLATISTLTVGSAGVINNAGSVTLVAGSTSGMASVGSTK